LHTAARVSEGTPAAEAGGKDLLWFIAEGTAATVGEQFFQCLVKHMAVAFRSDVAFVAEVVPEDRERARFLACWEGAGLAEPVEYRLAGTPCAEVRDSEVVSYTDGVRERFPEDEMVVELGLDSYLAVALRGSDGSHIGHLGVLAAAPLVPDAEKIAALRIFAARAASELERRRHERALREREALHRALGEEQAALRRVATLVATEAPQQELFDSVAGEVGLLLGADVASLVRLHGHRVKIVAGWSATPDRSVPTGVFVDVDRATATKEALKTGRPARAENIDLITDGAQVLRDLGIRSSVAAPISAGARLWGAVTAARTREDSFPAGAETRLGDFAELVAQAIANAEAREELTASRARIVQASDAERRRIERNLHDGAQQRLVTLSLSLRLAERRLQDEPRAVTLLAQISQELSETLQELRELARGIHPAVLTDRGLDAALEALATRAPLPVELLSTPGERLPEPIEATAYYIVAESLTNVAKYAHATAATVAVTRTDRRLLVQVRDDGVGGADVTQGSGLRGLADRAEALRGTLRIESPTGRGTVITAKLPLGPA
jgi:signal transduction histidine kinase